MSIHITFSNFQMFVFCQIIMFLFSVGAGIIIGENKDNNYIVVVFAFIIVSIAEAFSLYFCQGV